MTRDSVKMAVVGAGYVGIATTAGLAEHGRNIVLLERDSDQLEALAGVDNPTTAAFRVALGLGRCPSLTAADGSRRRVRLLSGRVRE